MFDICLDDHYFSVCLAPSQLHVISHPCSTQPSISLAYSVSILLVTSCLLLLFYFRCFTVTISVAAITSISQLLLISRCKQCISGAVELTTQLLKLINILWLPLCRIYKLGYSYPRRLLRSPTLVGHQVSSCHFSMPEIFWRRLYNLYDVDSLETELSLKKSRAFKVE